MRPYVGPPWTNSHQIWNVEVFHHAIPIYGIQNAEMLKKKQKKTKLFVTSSLRYSILLLNSTESVRNCGQCMRWNFACSSYVHFMHCAIASYHQFHSHAQVKFLICSLRWTGVRCLVFAFWCVSGGVKDNDNTLACWKWEAHWRVNCENILKILSILYISKCFVYLISINYKIRTVYYT